MAKTRKEKAGVEQKQLKSSETALSKTKVQISTTRTLIQTTAQEIQRKEKEVEALSQKLDMNKTILENYIQEAYYNYRELGLDISFVSDEYNDASENFNQLVSIKEKIISTINDIDQSKKDLETAQADLEDKKGDHEKLLSIQQGQQSEISQDIQQAQATLSELDAKINNPVC